MTPTPEWLARLRALVTTDGLATKYRVGTKVGRTIYEGDGLIGVMDDPEVAACFVAARMALPALLDALDEARERLTACASAARATAIEECAQLADARHHDQQHPSGCGYCDDIAAHEVALLIRALPIAATRELVCGHERREHYTEHHTPDYARCLDCGATTVDGKEWSKP